jgi:hypothetical protein
LGLGIIDERQKDKEQKDEDKTIKGLKKRILKKPE